MSNPGGCLGQSLTFINWTDNFVTKLPFKVFLNPEI